MTLREQIAHLLRRAGFGATPAEIDAWTAKGLTETVQALTTAPDQPEVIEPPEWKQPFDPTKLGDQQAYWIHRMVTTSHPLIEKLTLFWHGHFATGIKKVGRVEPMVTQNALLRRYALGFFPDLLREITKDAAMLIWLDGNNSSVKAPNENYGREVMELFTMGRGAYTETDIKQGARAFTGWHVDGKTHAVTFNKRSHDAGVKTFLGQTGNFGVDEMAGILGHRPETAKFISAKLWRYFASPVPDQATVAKMADTFLLTGGHIAAVLQVLFTSDAFYAPAVLQTQIKSPAEFVAGVLRAMQVPVQRDAAAACTRMGQVLYDPSNVGGWPGGTVWLGASTMLARINYGEGVKAAVGQKPDTRWLGKADNGPALVDWWLDYLGVSQPLPQTRAALLKLAGQSLPPLVSGRWELTRNLVRTIIAAPEFQAT